MSDTFRYMVEKPTYLGLLNAVAVNETANAALFTAWAGGTSDPATKAVLRTVALREAEHALSFAKRIDELGFDVEERQDPTLVERIELASSPSIPDREKFERLGYGAPRPDVFGAVFLDTSIDIETGALLGRFIAEERDSARRIDAAYERLVAAARSNSEAGSAASESTYGDQQSSGGG